jgi:hypothetical protein
LLGNSTYISSHSTAQVSITFQNGFPSTVPTLATSLTSSCLIPFPQNFQIHHLKTLDPPSSEELIS